MYKPDMRCIGIFEADSVHTVHTNFPTNLLTLNT